MEYLDIKHRLGESPISGRDWYNQEASRAINQAIGRVIRHINDFGLICLADKRFADYRTKNERSKWVRERQISFKNPEHMQNTVSKFFEDMKARNFPVKKQRQINTYDSDEGEGMRSRENSVDSNTGFRNRKFRQSNLNSILGLKPSGNNKNSIASYFTGNGQKPKRAPHKVSIKATE